VLKLSLMFVRLMTLGAKQITCRRDVDAEDRQTINEWIDAVLKVLDSVFVQMKTDYLCSLDFECVSSNGPSREYPFSSVLKVTDLIEYPLLNVFKQWRFYGGLIGL